MSESSNREYVVYDTTGQIQSIHHAPYWDYEILFGDLPLGWQVIEGAADPTQHYVAGGEVLNRPELPVTQSGTTFTVPSGTQFLVSGPASVSGTVVDGELELDIVEPGDYTVTFVNFPYKPWSTTVEG